MRIFGLNNKIFKILVYVGSFLSLGCAAATVIMLLTMCRPTSYFWTQYGPDAPQGTCANTADASLSIGCINLALDFYLLAIPIPQILKLNMSRRRKFVLCGLILVGGM